jgi:hypothetical protein
MKVRNRLFDCHIPGIGEVRVGDVIDVPDDVARDLLAAGWEEVRETERPPKTGKKPKQEEA